MPQLDFREALSTPEEKFFSPAATVSAIAAAVPVDQRAEYFARGFGFTRATWANIVFVAIASIGGLVCAFYFFNGGELLRAAASWPSEFLYPRPLSTERIDIAQLPDPVDQFARNETSSSKTDQAKATSENNAEPSNFSQPATTIGSTTPTGTSPVDGGGTPVFPPPAPPPIPPPVSLPTVPSLPATPPLPDTPSLPSVVDVPPAPSVDSLLQSLDQTPTSMVTKSTTVQTAKNKSSSTKRKVASTAKKISTASATSTAKNMQQGANQTQQIVNQTQMGGLNHAPNQIMTAGGLGGGLGGGAAVGGAAVGGGVGAVGGGLGGLGGLNGGGLGGGISGTLGGLGGVVGGKH
jgi:hypothetical protein